MTASSDITADTGHSAKWRAHFLLLLIFVGALAPRVIGLGVQLRDYYHPDEDKEIRRALALYRGKIDLRRAHKGGLFMVLAAEYGALYVSWHTTGRVSTQNDFAVEVFRDLETFIYLSRLTVALLGAGCAVLAFFLARHLAGRGAGLIAALLVAVHPQLIELSRFGRLDIPLTFCVLLFFVAAIRARGGGSLLRLGFAVVAAGLVVSCKSSGAPYLIAFVPAALPWFLRNPGLRNTARALALFFATGVIVVLLFNPAMVALVFGFGDEGGLLSKSAADVKEQYDGLVPSRVTNYIMIPARSIGVVGLAAAAFGVFSLLRKRRARALRTVPWWLLGVLLQVIMLWLISALVNWRYLLQATPIFIVLAAVGIAHATRAVSGHGQRRMVALGATLVLAGLYGYQSAGYLRNESRQTTQRAARLRIETHVTAGTGIVLEGQDYFPAAYMPRLRHTSDSLNRAADENEDANPGKAYLIRTYAIDALGGRGYDIRLYRYLDHATATEWARKFRTWRDQGMRYLVKRRSVIAGGDFRKSVEAFEAALKDVGAVRVPWGPLAADDRSLRGVTLEIYAFETQ